MSVSSDLRTVLKNRITALSSVGNAYDYRELNPSDWPAVWILPANLSGTFVTTSENRRIFGYEITILVTLGQDLIKDSSITRERYAENTIGAVLDDIIDDLDKNTWVSTFADISDADTEYLFAEAADAEWGEVDMQHGKAKAVRITLMIHTDFTARSS